MKVNRVVFFVSAGLIAIFVAVGGIFPTATGDFLAGVQSFIVTRFGWLYRWSVTFFLFFVLWLLIGRYGNIKLGTDDSEPEYNRLTWFAMLFSAGMGIGLMFFSVAEPLMHFSNPLLQEANEISAHRALGITFFHWGLHAWSTYLIFGLSMSYFCYRKGLPLTVRSVFSPLLGERVYGAIGNAIDILAVFGTLFGVATSLGLGVQQINAGAKYLGILDESLGNQIALIAGITTVATISVVTGVNYGIRRLSEFNLFVGLLLLVFVLFAGPTGYLVQLLGESLLSYPKIALEMTYRGDSVTGTQWQKSWTLFYWGWWISWAPFVGMFIARISKGRTIREFILGVLLVPTMLTMIWLTVFGGTSLSMEQTGIGGLAKAANESAPTALFMMLERLPWSTISSVFATVVIATYFVTSSDSASMVIDIITADGDPNPPVRQRIFWAVTEGVVAIILLLAGGLVALQTAAITTGLPLCVLMLLACWCLWKALRKEGIKQAS